MPKGRLEAFSDGVIAVIITIMVLELKAPPEGSLESLRALLPTFLGYVLSFLHVGIYWNNHHHLFQAVERINGREFRPHARRLADLGVARIPFRLKAPHACQTA